MHAHAPRARARSPPRPFVARVEKGIKVVVVVVVVVVEVVVLVVDKPVVLLLAVNTPVVLLLAVDEPVVLLLAVNGSRSRAPARLTLVLARNALLGPRAAPCHACQI